MSVNTAHANRALLIHAGEYILIHCKNTSIEFSGQKSRLFNGTKQGCIYLTSHRMIFKSCRQTDFLSSFSAPYITISNIKLLQQEDGTAYITGKIRSQPNGNFTGIVKFTLYLNSSGAFEFFQALQYALSHTFPTSNCIDQYPELIPPYTRPRAWYEAPLGVYESPPEYLKLPHSDIFPDPKPNSLYLTDSPPPYPGIEDPSRKFGGRTCDASVTPCPSKECSTPTYCSIDPPIA